MVSKGRGNFLKVKCLDCDNEQVIFDRAASDVNVLFVVKLLSNLAVLKLKSPHTLKKF